MKTKGLAEVEKPVQTFTLDGSIEKPIFFDVTMNKAGEADFTWTMEPIGEGADNMKLRDSVQCKFAIRPPYPDQTRSLSLALESGKETDLEK